MKRILLLFVLLMPAVAVAQQGVTENYGPVVKEIVDRGDRVIAAYDPANGVVASNELSRIYFDIFETSGMEFTLGLKDNALMLKIEAGFSQLISGTMRGSLDRPGAEKVWQEMKVDMAYAVEHYSSGEGEQSFWGRTFQSFLILFREGIEAMLVVAALVAYLRRSGFSDKVPVIWGGVGGAVVASVGAAWLLSSLFDTTGAGMEAIEGITMLIAVVVLIYVSWWLTAKRDADRWQAFIKEKMDRAIGSGSLFALGFAAFLAVFREGAETILFYQALIAGTSGEMGAIWTGMVLACVGLAGIYLVIRVASIRLPLSLFFGVTAVLLYAMAVVFTGQGILELQVSGMVPTNRIDGMPMISWLGVFPNRETLTGQAIVLALLPLGWIMVKMRGRQGAAHE